MFKQVADIRTADTMDLDVPDHEVKIVNVEATELQQQLVQELADRADVVNSGGVDPSVDNMLKITSDGRKLGLDPRLIDPSLEDNQNTKLNQCVANVLRIHKDTEADRLTQIIFCDLGVPHKSSTPDKETANEGEEAEIETANARIMEIDKYIQALFESKMRGEIDSDVFGSLSKTYNDEKTALKRRVTELIVAEGKAKESAHDVRRFYTALAKYDRFDELNAEILHDLVDRIEIGSLTAKERKAGKVRKIVIYYIGIGALEMV